MTDILFRDKHKFPYTVYLAYASINVQINNNNVNFIFNINTYIYM